MDFLENRNYNAGYECSAYRQQSPSSKNTSVFSAPLRPVYLFYRLSEEWPEKIDIVFLDSEQKDSECISHLKDKETPIVLLSRSDETLKELSPRYPAVLKKPIRYSQLQDIIHQLIPETRSFKASPYLKFYENTSSNEEEPAALQKSQELDSQEPNSSQELNSQTADSQEPLEKDIPVMLEENSEKLKNPPKNTSSESASEKPVFKPKPSIVVPEDMQLVDSADSTALHNTNTFLKKVSEDIKEKLSLKDTETSSENPFSEWESSEGGRPVEEPVQEEPVKEEPVEEPQTSSYHNTEEAADSQILEEEETLSEDSSNSPEETAVFTSSFNTAKEEPPDVLSNKILETIEKKVQDQWESFVSGPLKKDLKEMIHREVTQVFKEQMKDILTTEGIQSIKKASEEISWKVIPELSKQIIQKEIQKLLDKPSPSK